MNIIITGASRGIGLELTRLALEAGDRVLAVARHPEESAGLSELGKKFAKTLQTAALELTEVRATGKIEAAMANWDGVDILINNAGVFHKGVQTKDFMDSFQVNAVVPFQVTTALLPKLRKSKTPKVVQITSLMGSIADNSSGGSEAYRASKSALNMLNKCLAIQNDWLITTLLHPGWVKTDMGGESAPVEPAESAAGIWKVIAGLSKKDNGAFFDFRGRSLPW